MTIKIKRNTPCITVIPENYSQSITILSHNGHVLHVNHSFEQLTGFLSAELINKKYYPWIPHPKRSGWFSGVVSSLLDGKTKWEERFETKVGEGKCAEITITPVRFKRQEQSYLLTWQDVTEGTPNQQVLQEIQEFNSNLLENSPYPIIVLNSDTSIKYVNETFESLTGFSCEELIGRKAPYPWWAEKSTPARIRRLKNSMEKGEHKFERMFCKKNGELFWAEITSRAIRENGKLKYYLSNWVDTTERKQAEEKLTKLAVELRNLSAHLETTREKEREKIAKEIHDELGQVLTALQLEIDWLSGKLNKNQKQLVNKTHSISKLIEGAMTSVHKICSELMPKILDDVGLVAAIEFLANEFEEVTTIICKVRCDQICNYLDRNLAMSIYRIIQGAITNVVRHARATKVWISIKCNANELKITIKDNGVGITREQVFSPESYGIMVMRERVNFWKGKINISGTQNVGTKIAITIPLTKFRSIHDKDTNC
jgi:PAS domain S-box-containing protein